MVKPAKGKDNPHIDVEQLQPGEHLRIDFKNGARREDVVIAIERSVYLTYHMVTYRLQLPEVVYQ